MEQNGVYVARETAGVCSHTLGPSRTTQARSMPLHTEAVAIFVESVSYRDVASVKHARHP